MTLIHSTVSFNTTGATNPVGAGIVHIGAALIVTDSTISGNTTTGFGGGLYAGSSFITITNSTINKNSASNGGGIYSTSSALVLVNSTLSGNTSTGSGGGLLEQAAGIDAKFAVRFTRRRFRANRLR